ncbi:MAG: hypothetical protein RL418_44 [Actinomycetota bacterium]
MKSHSELEIDRPQRWAKQVSNHLGHKAELKEEATKYLLTFGFGASAQVSWSDSAVLMDIEAETPEALEKAKQVVGGHLLRFAKLDQTHDLTWS